MELIHFSHEHPLILTEEQKNDGEEVVCYGCQKSILDSSYCCSDCTFFLHKRCAELPRELKHPMHSEHPLTLLARPPYGTSSCICNVCRFAWKWFTYHCSLCGFDIDVSCVLEERVIKQESHEHPLIAIQRPALFQCDACGVEEKDFSYLCTTCPFWIHRSCARSPAMITRSDHDHPLILERTLPDASRSFKQYCGVCNMRVHPIKWVYYCAKCRYYVHVKCAASEKELLRDEEPEILDPNLMHFPMLEESDDLVKVVLLGNKELAEVLNHFSHDHVLKLFDSQGNQEIQHDSQRILCDGCLRPISSPFYGCDECSFFLHQGCSELPRELVHQFHPKHLLDLEMPSDFTDFFNCNMCGRSCNGFKVRCRSCMFHLDIKCACLPSKIKHESHKHPLVQCSGSYSQCKACGGHSFVMKYGCYGCDFYLDNYCALLPAKIWHRYDEHPFTLAYPPFQDHPDEFYCEICEKEINPRFWLYHCRDCDQSFHTRCIRPDDEYSNIKFGGTKETNRHPHSLSFVRKSKNRSPTPCDRCGERRDGHPVLECAPCNFQLCLPSCAWSM